MDRRSKGIKNPVVERSVVFELKSAEGMGDLFYGVRETMGVVIHGVNTPRIACSMVMDIHDSVNNRITHIKIGRCHINLCTQDMAAFCKISVFHFFEKFEVFFYGTIAIRAFFSRLCESATIFTHFFRA